MMAHDDDDGLAAAAPQSSSSSNHAENTGLLFAKMRREAADLLAAAVAATAEGDNNNDAAAAAAAARVLEYELALDCAPLDVTAAPPLSAEAVSRVLRLATSGSRALSGRYVAASRLLEEASAARARALSKAAYDALAARQQAAAAAAVRLSSPSSADNDWYIAAQHAPDQPVLVPLVTPLPRAAAVGRPLLPCAAAAAATNEEPPVLSAASDTPNSSGGDRAAALSARARELAARSLLARPEALGAMSKVSAECLKARRVGLFAPPLPRPLKPDEFAAAQAAAADAAARQLREDFLPAVKLAVKSELQYVGKGWLNFAEASRAAYDAGKLRRLLVRVRLQQQAALRDVALASAARFTELISAAASSSSCAAAAAPGSSGSSGSGSDDPSSGDGDAGAKRGTALITTELVLSLPDDDDKGANASSKGGGAGRAAAPEIRLAHSPAAIKAVVLDCFDRALRSLQGLPDPEPFIMTQLRWPGEPKVLAAPSADEGALQGSDPELVAARRALATALDAALAPVQAQLEASWRRHLFPRAESPPSAAAADAASGGISVCPPVTDVRAAAEAAAAALDAAARDLPESMRVGFVRVDCAKARALLLARRGAELAALRDALAAAPRAVMAAAAAAADELERALRATRTSGDGNGGADDDGAADAARRAVVEGAPARLAALLKVAESAQPWYEALEALRTPLSDADMALRAAPARRLRSVPVAIERARARIEARGAARGGDGDGSSSGGGSGAGEQTA